MVDISADSITDLDVRANRLAEATWARLLRQERKRQAEPYGGLLAFIRYFWEILEPAQPFVEGWALQMMCEHLEAVSRGDRVVLGGIDRKLNRVLMNVPPGFMKSLLVNVFWPAWEWGPCEKPHLRYVAFSYASELTERDNQKFRDLICSEPYREMWGHVYKVLGDGKVRITNDKTGFKFASSIGGVGTGERGDRVLCFAGDQKVATEHGPLPIRDIVEGRLDVKALSFNEREHRFELSPIVGWHKSPGRPLVKVVTDRGDVVCTRDHEIYTTNGKVAASALGFGDILLAATSGVSVASASVARQEFEIEMLPGAPSADVVDCACADTKFLGEKSRRVAMPSRDLTHDALSKVRGSIAKRAVLFAVGNVLCARAVLKVIKTTIRSSAVFVLYFLALWTRALEGFHRQLMNLSIRDFTVLAQADARIPLVGGSLENFGGDRQRAIERGIPAAGALSLNNASYAADPTKAGDFIEPLEADNWKPKLARVLAVRPLHEVPSHVYCLTVEGNHNLLCGKLANIICSNCDDIHKIKATESDESRKSTVTWGREAMSNRLNSLAESVIIAIMQRTHEEDFSGAIMKHHSQEYCHLIIPMEYESHRHLTHLPGFEDPRTYDGELAWPERYRSLELGTFRANPYLWAGQYQQNPAPRGGGLFKEDWWQLYEIPPSRQYEIRPILCVASLDTAFKEKEEDDYSALTVWWLYDDPKPPHYRKIMMVDSWKKKLPLNGPRQPRKEGENENAWLRRVTPKWGVVEWTHFMCVKRGVTMLLIEDAARGHDVNKELQRLYANTSWGVHMVPARGDKWSRAHSVVDIFTDDMVVAPGEWLCARHNRSHCMDILCPDETKAWHWRDWAKVVIDECSLFPRAAHDDCVDTVTQVLRYLRQMGYLVRRDEKFEQDQDDALYRPTSTPLYPV